VDTAHARTEHPLSDPLAPIDAEFHRREPPWHGLAAEYGEDGAAHLEAGRLVELIPGAVVDVPLYWQVNRLAADRLADLTRKIVETAGRELTHTASTASTSSARSTSSRPSRPVTTKRRRKA
jgi:hypothetical protein